MLTFDKLVNIIFFAAVCVLAAIFVISILIKLCRKKRTRNGGDVFLLTLNFIFLIVALASTALTVFIKYPDLLLAVKDVNGALGVSFGTKVLFDIPKCGFIVAYIIDFKLFGVIATGALTALSLINVIVYMAKTPRGKKTNNLSFKPECPQGFDKAENSVSFGNNQNTDEFLSVNKTLNSNANTSDSDMLAIENFSSDESKPDAAKVSAVQSVPAAKHILEEIDLLVESDSPTLSGTNGDVDKKLKNAIAEALNFADEANLLSSAPESAENTNGADNATTETAAAAVNTSVEPSLVKAVKIPADTVKTESVKPVAKTSAPKTAASLPKTAPKIAPKTAPRSTAPKSGMPRTGAKSAAKSAPRSTASSNIKSVNPNAAPSAVNPKAVKSGVRTGGKPPVKSTSTEKSPVKTSVKQASKPEVPSISVAEPTIHVVGNKTVTNRRSAADVYKDYLKNKNDQN